MRSPRYHVIVDVDHCRIQSVEDEDGLRAFIGSLVSLIGMHVLVGPYSAQGIAENPGVSAFAVIDYSHVSIHTFTRFREAMIDVFSCKPFDEQVVRDTCLAYFGTESSSVRQQTVWWEGGP